MSKSEKQVGWGRERVREGEEMRPDWSMEASDARGGKSELGRSDRQHFSCCQEVIIGER